MTIRPKQPRILLSPPDVGGPEREALLGAFDSNWIAPVGPHLERFERSFESYVGTTEAVAVSSGTAALHLALLLYGVRPADKVVVPTLTFVATANAVVYTGAEPVFVDCDAHSWNISPEMLSEILRTGAAKNELPAAVISVDLYGQLSLIHISEPTRPY